MFVPFVSTPSIERRKLWKRKGGGGGGRGGGSSGGGRGSSGGASSGRSSSVSTAAGTKSASSYSRGGGSPITISSGAFAGRTAGGGTRGQVYGTSQYGSGYPGVAGRGVAGRGFPFFFWPIAFGGAAGLGGAAYLHNSEYGNARNNSRPGGQQTVATFISATSSDPQSTFRLLADKDTVEAAVEAVNGECGTFLRDKGAIPVEEYDGSDVEPPHPEQVVQYYRASSVALSLDGYNNTAALQEDENAPNVPLPSAIDNALLDCLNTTIGESVPLVDGAISLGSPSSIAVFGLAGIVWLLSSQL